MGKPELTDGADSMTQVYPHGYGETMPLAWRRDELMGLSPRVWGNLASTACPKPVIPYGSIPTGMGKPKDKARCINPSAVYPHGYGETILTADSDLDTNGLSPRVWGNQITSFCGTNCTRSIPTGMGKPHVAAGDIERDGVYPHGYGETF